MEDAITQENGAITKIVAYVAERDGAVVVEIDTDANFDSTAIRVHVNDDIAWEGTVQ